MRKSKIEADEGCGCRRPAAGDVEQLVESL